MAGFIEKVIDSIFGTIEKQELDQLSKDPEFQKQLAAVDKRAKEINSTLDDMDKKYGIKTKRY